MEVYRFDLDHLPPCSPGLSLALGNFDGFHKGHQSLFVKTALDASSNSGALIFETPFGNGPFLSSSEDKKRYALSSRLDSLYVLSGKEVYSLSAEEFIRRVLLPLGTKRVVVGEDFRFGKDRSGDVSLLKEYFDVDVVPFCLHKGVKVSSRSIKELLSLGQVEEAAELLGKPYEVSGIVAEGFHNGRKIGYPTLNLSLTYDYVLPMAGVYCGVVYVSGVAYRAMVNVGTNPTLGLLDKPIVEAYLLDYEGECYGKLAYCAFLRFLREERKFGSLEELKAQLEIDEANVKESLS
ncbi:MAG: riboflavin biosynthesis protein RibF [Bacilli bacterium]|nr:riboflavin biosynthesis protein RibF [Bacilli bacterium]